MIVALLLGQALGAEADLVADGAVSQWIRLGFHGSSWPLVGPRVS